MVSNTSASLAGIVSSSIAQARSLARITVPLAPMATAAVAVAADFRNRRRSRMCLLMLPSQSAVASVPLQNLDLVPIGVRDEEESRHQATIAVELLDRIRPEAGGGQAGMHPIQVVHAERDMPIAVAVLVGLGAALVERELDLEIGLRVAQI